jgi:hypothetical protein
VRKSISINYGNLEKRKQVEMKSFGFRLSMKVQERIQALYNSVQKNVQFRRYIQTLNSERGDVPGWVLVVLMTTGLVTAIWTIAAPRLTSILKNSLDSMNGIR